jgi:hypothetical protein
MLTCKEAAQLLSDSLDRKLPLSQRISLRIHLLMCKLCPRFQKQLQFLKDSLNQYQREAGAENLFIAVSLSEDARGRIRRALAGGSENS